MAEEQQVPEDVVTQEPDAPQPEVQEAEAEPEVDWKARFDDNQATLDKLEQQLKTEQGRNKKRDDTDSAVFGIGDRLAAMEQSNAALIKALILEELAGHFVILSGRPAQPFHRLPGVPGHPFSIVKCASQIEL